MSGLFSFHQWLNVKDCSLPITTGCTSDVDAELLNGSDTNMTQSPKSRSQSILSLSLKPLQDSQVKLFPHRDCLGISLGHCSTIWTHIENPVKKRKLAFCFRPKCCSLLCWKETWLRLRPCPAWWPAARACLSSARAPWSRHHGTSVPSLTALTLTHCYNSFYESILGLHSSYLYCVRSSNILSLTDPKARVVQPNWIFVSCAAAAAAWNHSQANLQLQGLILARDLCIVVKGIEADSVGVCNGFPSFFSVSCAFSCLLLHGFLLWVLIINICVHLLW